MKDSFARIEEQERVHYTCSIVLSLTSASGCVTDLNEWDRKSGSNRKRNHVTGSEGQIFQTVYLIKGRRITAMNLPKKERKDEITEGVRGPPSTLAFIGFAFHRKGMGCTFQVTLGK